MSMQTSELFATPLWSFQHPEQEQLRTWGDHILELERRDAQGVRLTNPGGWHSRTNLLENPKLNALFLWIASCTQKAMFEPICIPTACSVV
jgi:hypothetical protein